MKTQELKIPQEIISIISPEIALNYSVIPKYVDEDSIGLYTSTEDRDQLIEELEIILGKRISLEIIPDDLFQTALHRFYRSVNGKRQKDKQITIQNQGEDFIKKIIEEAFYLNASDIHIEPLKDKCRIRFRIDGKLVEQHFIDKKEYPIALNKIKVNSNLDIAEKRLPQDGRLTVDLDEVTIDIRVSSLPSVFGEKVVLRLLSNSMKADIGIEKLGLSYRQIEDISTGIKRTSGLILFSGPTGSGKTTSLYSILKLLNKSDVNILTIEDPVEYMIDGANQVQLKENIGLTFANALRTFLRQDPDIIMLGEIRDPETAQMAIRASLTGHLVLSTIHTNSAWGTVTRLVDMGIPPFLIADTLIITASQRLIRKLCAHCKTLSENNDALIGWFPELQDSAIKSYTATGCPQCHYSGYKGRIGIYEVIPVNKVLTQFIKERKTDIQEYLALAGIHGLSETALKLVKDGITSIEEILPIIIHNGKTNTDTNQ